MKFYKFNVFIESLPDECHICPREDCHLRQRFPPRTSLQRTRRTRRVGHNVEVGINFRDIFTLVKTGKIGITKMTQNYVNEC